MRASAASLSAPEPPAPRRLTLWWSLTLIGLATVVYAPTVHFDFVNYDDLTYVTSNPHVVHGLSRSAVAWAFTTGYAANWHPLTWVSHMLDVQFFGLNPGLHHLTNVVLHALNTLLVFIVFRTMTGREGPSAFVAALFAAHPLHVESVAWIAERKDLLSACFWLLTMWAYVAYVRRGGARRYVLVVVTLALGLMAKPMLVTLPFVLLLVDAWPLRRRLDARLVVEKLPLFALAVASSIITFAVQQGGGAVKGLRALPFGGRAANAVVAYVTYIAQMVWPSGLAAIRPYPASLPAFEWVGAAALLIGITAAAVRMWTRRPYIAVGWF